MSLAMNGPVETSKHEADHGNSDPCLTTLRESLVVLTQSPIPSEPSERPLDDPPLGQDNESLLVSWLLHNLQQPTERILYPLHELTTIRAVCPNERALGNMALESPKHELRSVAVLDIGRMHHDRQQ